MKGARPWLDYILTPLCAQMEPFGGKRRRKLDKMPSCPTGAFTSTEVSGASAPSACFGGYSISILIQSVSSSSESSQSFA